MQALRDHVDRFNVAVQSGDYEPMLAAYADDAELVFVGVPVGPFHGRHAIAEAYRTQPPDDEILLLDEREEDGDLVAGYAWAREPDVRAGELRLTVRDGRTQRLVVTFQ
ncbi:MAG: nuclear transport factor 2 family protein [Gaiellaceae bacterium]